MVNYISSLINQYIQSKSRTKNKHILMPFLARPLFPKVRYQYLDNPFQPSYAGKLGTNHIYERIDDLSFQIHSSIITSAFTENNGACHRNCCNGSDVADEATARGHLNLRQTDSSQWSLGQSFKKRYDGKLIE